MALHITDECSSCGACEPECPNGAISEGEDHYMINPDLCTECVGHFAEPQCMSACPTDSIEKDPNHQEDQDALLAKFKKLHPDKEPVLS
jgi:ferredoxin